MARVIISEDVIYSTINKNSVLEPRDNIGQIPTLYDKDGYYVSVVNSWFLHLAIEHKNLNSYQRALLSYWRFLESKQLQWDHFNGINSEKPTYRYKNEFLVESIKNGNLERSTANTYIGHIIQFYKWSIHHRFLIIKDERCAPFQIELVKVNNHDMLAHLRPQFFVETSDLRIRVGRSSITNNVRGLCPLNEARVHLLKTYLHKESIEFKLVTLLILLCGLRVEEACSFTSSALDNAVPNESNTAYDIEIGPTQGIRTKYDKTRNIVMTDKLYQVIKSYHLSDRRMKRLEKLENNIKASKINAPIKKLQSRKRAILEQAKFYDSIFISQQGNPFTKESINTRWSQFRAKIKNFDPNFNHKLYDCRSTYATFLLKFLLDSGFSASDAIEYIMEKLGHNDEKTVWNYIKFLNRKELHQEKFGILDQIMEEALNEYAQENW